MCAQCKYAWSIILQAVWGPCMVKAIQPKWCRKLRTWSTWTTRYSICEWHNWDNTACVKGPEVCVCAKGQMLWPLRYFLHEPPVCPYRALQLTLYTLYSCSCYCMLTRALVPHPGDHLYAWWYQWKNISPNLVYQDKDIMISWGFISVWKLTAEYLMSVITAVDSWTVRMVRSLDLDHYYSTPQHPLVSIVVHTIFTPLPHYTTSLCNAPYHTSWHHLTTPTSI